jgi:hypothetical protein
MIETIDKCQQRVECLSLTPVMYGLLSIMWNGWQAGYAVSVKMYLLLLLLVLTEYHLTKSTEILRPRGVSISSNVFLK